MPNTSPSPLVCDGAISGSDRFIINNTFEQCLIGNTAVVQATNPTSAANLMTAVFQQNTMTTVGQSLEIFGAGITNLTTSASTLTIAVILGGVTIATFVTGSVAAGALNLPWQLNLNCTVASVTNIGAITLESHGTLCQALTTVAAGFTTYNDSNIAVSSSIAAQTQLTLQITALLGTGNAASFVNQRQLIVDILN